MWLDQRGSEVLSRSECLRLLAAEANGEGVGRLAMSRPGAPIVQPVNFSYCRGDVVVRLGDGFMAEEVPGRLVAVEVDRVDHERGVAWSVLVRGLARELDADARRELEDPDGFATAGRRGRSHAPRPLAPNPGSRLVAVRPDVVTGRRFALHDSTSSLAFVSDVRTSP